MPLILRLTKGSELEIAELDGNFTYLDDRISVLNTTVVSQSSQLTETPQYYKDAGSISGLENELERLPLVRNPVESLAHSAIGFSSTILLQDQALDSFVIKGGTLGVNSLLQIEPLWTFTSSANNKILKVNVEGVTVYSATRTFAAREAPLIVLANRNSLSSQIQPYDSTYVTADANSPATYAIDFSKDVRIEFLGQRADGGDTLKLEYYRVLHFLGA